MGQHINQIRNTLSHEDFDNIGDFPQIADEENYETERNGVTLNEAVADFEQISNLLETAVDNEVIESYAVGQRNNIQKRLQNTRKQASSISNRNSARNNPGRNFINSVDNLKSYVIGELSLDLRAGEYLDFSDQLNKLKQIRENQQKSRQNLAEAEETNRKVDHLHSEITSKKEAIDDILGSATEVQDELRSVENNASSAFESIREKEESISNHYEEVLKKSEQINNYEDRLESSLSDVEQRSEELDQQQDDLAEIEERINTLLNGAVAASLDRNFTERKEELEQTAQRWARLTLVAIIALIGGAGLIFINITQIGEFGAGTISRVTLLIPLLVGVWFTSKNYSRNRRLMEEYAFKSTMAQTLEPSRKVLNSQESFDNADSELAEFMLVSMGQVFTNPSEIVEDGSTSSEDDATYIQTVMDLAKQITKRG